MTHDVCTFLHRVFARQRAVSPKPSGGGRILSQMPVSMVRSRLMPLALLLALTLACAEPPNKEIDRAEGAIEAARAAGADVYAPEPYNAAVTALTKSREAVTQRDYRLALNFALDAFEQAQEAARGAVDSKTKLRAEVDDLLRATAAALERANKRLSAPDASRTAGSQVIEARRAVFAAEASLQEARAALAQDNIRSARVTLNGLPDRVEAALQSVEAALGSRSQRRPR